MSISILTPRSGGDPRQTERIKDWVKEIFSLPNEATVMVTELRCSEPGCPPLETVIAIMDNVVGTRQHKLHKALAELTFADVVGLNKKSLHDQA